MSSFNSLFYKDREEFQSDMGHERWMRKLALEFCFLKKCLKNIWNSNDQNGKKTEPTVNQWKNVCLVTSILYTSASKLAKSA